MAVNRGGNMVERYAYKEVPVKPGTVAEVTMTPGQMSAPPPLTVTTEGRTTTIQASSDSARGPAIPQGGQMPPSAGQLPPNTTPAGGIGGTWITPSGDTVTLVQTGNRVTGTYRGALGTGTINGTFDGRNFTGTIEVGQGGISVTDNFSFRLTPEGRLEGQVGSNVLRVDVIMTRR
jgi:hypothetical protein